jgi:hypothetical protein
MAEPSNALRGILEKIRDDAQKALTLLGVDFPRDARCSPIPNPGSRSLPLLPDRGAGQFQESDCRSPLGFRQRI